VILETTNKNIMENNSFISAKKSLGQNFLKSKIALAKMLEAGEINKNDTVLEVGPGKGILTEKLLTVAKKVIVVEKDDRLIPLLKEKFAAEITNEKLEIIHGDILDFSPENHDLKSNSYKLVANIPYYITGLFLRKFLETEKQPAKIVIMVQKEIADRIIARKGGENLLSLSVKVYGEPKKIMRVDKENFSPAPKVDSAVLLIDNISKKFFLENKISEIVFFETLHAGFAHKRKMLLGNLKKYFKKQLQTKNLETVFIESNIPLRARAEELSLLNWSILLKNL
jgi:16S rRNA (adenine1518-N6/adenine1519-N6)-dimethyltransferase